MMQLHNPPHPGGVLLQDVLPALGIKIHVLAQHLHIDCELLVSVTQGISPVTPDLAYRLDLAGISNAEQWLRMQMAYDLWHLRAAERPDISKLYQGEEHA